MSLSFTLSGNSSILSYNFNPPIYLDDDVEYEVGLVNFNSFNTMPNIDESNNLFLWGTLAQLHEFNIPVGAYELDDIIRILKQHVANTEPTAQLEIVPDINTSKVSITSNRIISFNANNTIGNLLGFTRKHLEANKTHISDIPVNILKVNSIGVDCSIAAGSYLNGEPVHVIHQFFPTVPSGYKIVESPQNILYYPVSVKTINNITIKIIDQSNNLVNFRDEEVTVTLQIRKVWS